MFFVFRSFSDWYYLDGVLSQHFPHSKIQTLPPRRQLWIKDKQTKLEAIATFLLRVLSSKEIIRSKAVQLFLQTQICMNFIQENLEGKRNDSVSKVPKLDLKTEPKIINFDLPKVNQNTYHGSSDTYKSVKNLFNDNRKKSLIKPERNFKQTMY